MPGQMIPTGIATGAAGSIFVKEVQVSVGAGLRSALPVGTLYVYTVGADIRLQIQDSTGTWQNITAAGVIPGGVLISDGTNLALYNGGGGSENFSYIKVG